MNKRSIQKIAREVNQAYCDSNPEVPFDETMTKRNLNFKASAAVPKDEAVKIMTDALFCESPEEQGYNNFKPIFLGKIPEGKTLRKGFAKRVKIDECDTQPDGTIRLWWD